MEDKEIYRNRNIRDPFSLFFVPGTSLEAAKEVSDNRVYHAAMAFGDVCKTVAWPLLAYGVLSRVLEIYPK